MKKKRNSEVELTRRSSRGESQPGRGSDRFSRAENIGRNNNSSTVKSPSGTYTPASLLQNI